MVSDPLTRRQTLIVAVATVLTAATRLMALSSTLWDWDEGLFVLALRDYDVTLHQPHPPGFPLYIAAAKLFRFAGLPDFRALQAVNLVAACAIVPVAFLFARALRFRFTTSLVAAILLAFFPNVWFFGGTAFSDVPSMVLALGAAVLFLRDRPVAGSIVLGIAAGFRPQNLIVGGVPLIVAMVMNGRRERRPYILGAVVVGGIVIGSYFAAAQLSGGWPKYRQAVETHQRYIVATDSIGAPARPALLTLVDNFFVRPYHAPVINAIITLLATISIIAICVRPRHGPWLAVATFAPLALLSFLFLDWLSASRFSIGYAPLIALLAADGLALAARRFEGVVAAAIAGLMIAWTIPALREVREHPSPPAAAAEWIRTTAGPRTSRIYVHRGIAPQARALLLSHNLEIVNVEALPARVLTDQQGILYSEGISGAAGRDFVRPREPLASLHRPRYFEVTAVAPAKLVRFGDGWTADLTMQHRASMHMPSLEGDIRFSIALRADSQASVTIRVNGRAIETLAIPGGTTASRQYIVPDRAGGNEVVFECAGAAGVRLESMGWVSARRLARA